MTRPTDSKSFKEKPHDFSEIDFSLIKNSFRALTPYAVEFADTFYDKLFTNYPQVKVFFKDTDLSTQKTHFVEALVYCVENCENNIKFQSYLKNLGRSHKKINITNDDFNAVGSILIQTLIDFFGENWTADAQKNWTMFYNYMVENMKNSSSNDKNEAIQLIEIGEKSSAPTAAEPSLEQYIKHQAFKLIEQALSSDLEDEILELIRNKARKLLKLAISEEVKRQSNHLLKKAG